MSAALAELIELLDLERLDRDLYRGQNEKGGYGRLYGGQVAAQALGAAQRTTDGQLAHSLHAYFLRGGRPEIPVIYQVDRIRDGRSFTTRRVVAVQDGKAIFNLSVSFHDPETGFEHEAPMPEAPGPDELQSWGERLKSQGDKVTPEIRAWLSRERPLEYRSGHGLSAVGSDTGRSDQTFVWVRANGVVPDDPHLHQQLVAYASDMSLLDTIVRRHVTGMAFGKVMMASLDHAMWFHRPVRLDDWLLYAQDSPIASGARGFCRGSFYDRAGAHRVSVCQEGLIRPLAKPREPKSDRPAGARRQASETKS